MPVRRGHIQSRKSWRGVRALSKASAECRWPPPRRCPEICMISIGSFAPAVLRRLVQIGSLRTGLFLQFFAQRHVVQGDTLDGNDALQLQGRNSVSQLAGIAAGEFQRGRAVRLGRGVCAGIIEFSAAGQGKLQVCAVARIISLQGQPAGVLYRPGLRQWSRPVVRCRR